MVRLGIISAYPDEDWHAQRIVAAAKSRCEAEILSPLDFGADIDGSAQTILVNGESHRRFDAFLTPRALGEEGDHELQLELYRTLAEDGALIVNDVSALMTAIDKFKTSWVLMKGGIPTPRVLVTQRIEGTGPALAALGGRAVVKPLYGSLGIGVELVEAYSRERFEGCLKRWKALYFQAFVDGQGRDVRAFVVGAHVEGAIERIAPPGEFRTNVHLGAKATPVVLGEATEAVAVRAAKLLGLDYAGVDLLETKGGPVVLEVNGTPLFKGIWEATGRDMGLAIVEHVMARIAERNASGLANGLASRQTAKRTEERPNVELARGSRVKGIVGHKETAAWRKRAAGKGA